MIGRVLRVFGMPQFSSILLLAFLLGGLPGLLSATSLDATPPEFSRIDSCGAVRITLLVLDTAATDERLSEISVVGEPAGVSVRFDESFTEGDATAIVTVRLLEGYDAATVRIHARDRAGNADTAVIELGRVAPVFSGASLLFEEIPRNDRGEGRIVVSNTSNRFRVRIDSLRLTVGDRFSIDGFGRGGDFGYPMIPGDTFGIVLRFRPGLPRLNHDTLVIWIDCNPYRFPLEATVGIARLDVTNLDFWQVLIGSEECLQMTLLNPGTDTVRLTQIEVDGEFRFDTTKIPDLPLDVAPGEEAEIPICFLPRRLGLLLGTVTIISSEVDSTGTVSELAGIGVNSFSSVGFDDEGRQLQVTVVPQRRRLTVVSADRDRKLAFFRLYNTRGQEIRLDAVDRIGRGWWGITTPERLDVGIYFLSTWEEGGEPLTVKFVVLE